MLAETKAQMKNARTEMQAPFVREAELEQKTTRLKELNILLNMNEKDGALLEEPQNEKQGCRQDSRQPCLGER